MAIKVNTTCPFGHKCEKVVDDEIERCALYIELEGVDPVTGDQTRTSRCSMAWQTILLVEGNGVMQRTNANIQSLRNETVARQEKAMEVLNAKYNESEKLS
tara:strand:+ start:3500 stop:3802 length:303 start_codon:yes stop_codon:yes gene_type:complete